MIKINLNLEQLTSCETFKGVYHGLDWTKRAAMTWAARLMTICIMMDMRVGPDTRLPEGRFLTSLSHAAVLPISTAT